jgi:RES domain-containing protein
MRAYRIQKAKHKNDISGFGSTLVAGRWHQAGKIPMLYTSSNVSLAILECLVHLPPGVKPPDLLLLTLEIPNDGMAAIPNTDFPENWNKKGYYENVQRWGTAWLESRTSLAISVPSVISSDDNILINPTHPAFTSIVVLDTTSVTLDDRLI